MEFFTGLLAMTIAYAPAIAITIFVVIKVVKLYKLVVKALEKYINS